MGDSVIAALAAMILAATGSVVGTSKVIRQGEEALVERLGQYHRTLKPGLRFILPFFDRIVFECPVSEQVLDIDPQEIYTQDSVQATVDAVVFWQVVSAKQAYYEVENVELAISEIVRTTLRSKLGGMKLEQTFSQRDEINRSLLKELDEVTETWGIKVIRVEIQSITPSEEIQKALEQKNATRLREEGALIEAEYKKRQAIEEAQGRRQAAIIEAESTVEYIRQVAQSLEGKANAQEILQYLVTQRYVESNFKLSSSPNSKIIFMDPKVLTEPIGDLMNSIPDSPKGLSSDPSPKNGRSPQSPRDGQPPTDSPNPADLI